MISCPICKSPTLFLAEKKDRFGQKYEYLRCQTCRFLFEKDLVENKVDLVKRVSQLYQKDYFENVDPGWKTRGDSFLRVIKKAAALYKPKTVLDYGGGNGYIAAELSKQVPVWYYDKYDKPTITGNYQVLEKPAKVDLMYAVELVEHLVDINEWDFLKELSPKVFIFTTCVTDNIKENELLNWDYFNPDAGHMALYSCQSLHLLAKKYGFVYFFFPNIQTHIFLKNKFLSSINFVKVEYMAYSLFRKIKNLLK